MENLKISVHFCSELETTRFRSYCSNERDCFNKKKTLSKEVWNEMM